MCEFLVTILPVSLSALVLTPFLLLSLTLTHAAVMQSGSYRIQSDSINFGGGLASSTNFSLESTGGEVATGESSSATYKLKAGYQQMQEVFISLSGFSGITLGPSIPGISGGFSNGSTTVTVVTDSPSGYSLSIAASQNPAMQKGSDSISDYVPGGAVPDFTFTTDATDAHLGFTPEGNDIVTRFRDSVGVCGTGVGDTVLSCWDGLSTTPQIVSQGSGANHPNGATTTLNFRVGVGGSVFQPSGTYTATTTITALPL
jgi:hypothetical protein